MVGVGEEFSSSLRTASAATSTSIQRLASCLSSGIGESEWNCPETSLIGKSGEEMRMGAGQMRRCSSDVKVAVDLVESVVPSPLSDLVRSI